MSRCNVCSGKKERPCAHEDMTKEYFDVLMPALRFVAEKCGYAIGVHGSLKTDIDLIAAPWREHPVSAAHLADEIRKTIERIIGIADDRGQGPTKKPCGRLAWAFYMTPIEYPGPYIDLSVLPPGKHE